MMKMKPRQTALLCGGVLFITCTMARVAVPVEKCESGIQICEPRACPDYQSVVEEMLVKYPDSELRDIYKSIFQDRFGPGHLVADTMAAKRYLHSELMRMGESALPYYEPAGAGRNYYRVSLAMIRDGLITEDEFFRTFLESAGKVTFPTIEDWTAEWNDILKVIPTDLRNYDSDKAMIDSVLVSGNYAVHHSRRFNASYHPHYRLIDKSTFRTRLLPMLRK